MRGAFSSRSASSMARPMLSSSATCSGRGVKPAGNHGSRSGMGVPAFYDRARVATARLLDGRHHLDRAARRARQRVDHELAGADQEPALLLRVRDRTALDHALDDVTLAPDDREDAVVADLDGLPPV